MAFQTNGFMDLLKIVVVESNEGYVEMHMPITEELYQPMMIVHGGATLALLESAASYGAANNTDPERERAFGVNVNVNHRKSAREGMLRGIARLNRKEGQKIYWDVVAYDDEGDVVSEGSVLTLTVSLERLAEKERATPKGTKDGSKAALDPSPMS
ncbi:MAG: PaaI family thioesterase [Eggerthellaceae bacterium]|nr:PaaI family thioesterase [Eggerthellaceae bacterium]